MQFRPKAYYKQKSAKRLVPKRLIPCLQNDCSHSYREFSFTVYCSALGGTLMMTIKRNFHTIHFLPLFWVWISEAAV